jgi:hypothetical protein
VNGYKDGKPILPNEKTPEVTWPWYPNVASWSALDFQRKESKREIALDDFPTIEVPLRANYLSKNPEGMFKLNEVRVTDAFVTQVATKPRTGTFIAYIPRMAPRDFW